MGAPQDYNEVRDRIIEFREKVTVVDGCWKWGGKISRQRGYGYIYHRGREYVAHRVFYVALVGEVPPGLDLDHLCRNRWCVNPSHLEPVTRQVNLLRGRNRNREKTHCPVGHTLADAYIDGRGGRSCRACTLRRAAEARARRGGGSHRA